MECEKCGELAQVSKYLKKRVKIPVFRRENPGKRGYLMMGACRYGGFSDAGVL